jgi:hypothetical protein
MRSPTELTEIAWAAGFFDGEGHTQAKKDKRSQYRPYSLGVCVGQAERAPLERFRLAVGAGSIRGRKRRSPKHAPMWIWEAWGPAADKALDVLWPFLGETKRAQANEARRLIAAQPPPRDRLANLDRTGIGNRARWGRRVSAGQKRLFGESGTG